MGGDSGGTFWGALLGFVISGGNPFGAALGASIGNAIDSGLNKQRIGSKTRGQDILLHNVWLEFDCYENGEEGFKIHLSFEIHGYTNQDIVCFCYFTDRQGQPFRGQRQGYQDAKGRLIVGEIFSCPYKSAAYDDFTLFMPYDAFFFGEKRQLLMIGNVAFVKIREEIANYHRAFEITLTR